MSGGATVGERPPGSAGVGAGAAANPGRRASLREVARRPDARIALALVLFLFGFYALWAGGHTYSSDEEGLFQQTKSVLAGEYFIRVSEDNRPVTAIRNGRDGRAATVGGLGQSAAAVPLLVLGNAVSSLADESERGLIQRFFVGFLNSLVTALLGALVFLIARELGAPRTGAVLLALVYALGTVAWPHAKTFFSEPLAALLLGAGVLAAMRAGRGSRPVLLSALAGASTCAAVLVRPNALLFVPFVALYLAVVLVVVLKPGWRSTAWCLAAFCATGAVVGVVFALGNRWRYGSSTDVGYAAVPFDFSPIEGVYGLLASPGKGLFLYSPVVVVGLVAVPFAIRRRPLETLLLLGLVTANLILFARFVSWHAGQGAWGPRYMIAVLPFAVLLVAPLLASVNWRRAVLVTGAIGVAVSWLGVVMYANQYDTYVTPRLGVDLVDGEPRYYRSVHFDPEWSPIVGHLRLLDDVAENSAARIDGRDPSFAQYGELPTTTSGRYGWYFAPPQLDAWWYWIWPQGTAPWLLVLVAPMIACSAVGLGRLRRLRRQDWW